jgi:hypothetical protein
VLLKLFSLNSYLFSIKTDIHIFIIHLIYIFSEDERKKQRFLPYFVFGYEKYISVLFYNLSIAFLCTIKSAIEYDGNQHFTACLLSPIF